MTPWSSTGVAVAVILTLSACTESPTRHLSEPVTAKPSASSPIVPPVEVLVDPGSMATSGESTIATRFGSAGHVQIPLNQLPGSARHLILHWTCAGDSKLSFTLDGAPSASGCAGAAVISTGDIPLDQMPAGKQHPKVLGVVAGQGVRWRLTVSEVG